MNVEKRVYSELYEILKNIDKNKVMKLPKDIIDKIIKNRDVNIPVIIDWSRSLESQNFIWEITKRQKFSGKKNLKHLEKIKMFIGLNILL